MMTMTFQLKDFDGPLDLLLTLIGKAQIDIREIFVSDITEQYLQIVRNAPDLDMDEASDFLVMAATLVEIKSRAMLPKPPEPAEGEEDPEAELIRRLEEYKRYKESAESLRDFETAAKRIFTKLPEEYPLPPPKVELTGLTLEGLVQAFARIWARKPEAAEEEENHYARREIHRLAVLQLAGIEAHPHAPAQDAILRGGKHHAAQRTIRVCALRPGEHLHHRVQQGDDALVPQRRTAEDRAGLCRAGHGDQLLPQESGVDLLAREVPLQQRIILRADGLRHSLAIRHQHRIRRKEALHLAQYPLHICPLTVRFVQEQQHRDILLPQCMKERFRVGLHTLHRADDQHRRIQRPEAPLHLR